MEAKQGYIPPLQPRNLESRISAISPRETNSQISFQTVLSAAAKELGKSIVVMPDKKKLSRFVGIHRMGIASTNSIRQDHFEASFPGVAIHRMKGEEAHKGDVLLDAESKARTATEKYLAERRGHPLRRLSPENFWQTNPVTGPDALNAIPQVDTTGQLAFVRVGKPDRETPGKQTEAVQERFAQLSRMAKENNWPAIPYIVEQATYIKNTKRRDTKHDAYSIRQAVVLLDPAGLAFLATPEGFALYEGIVAKSYPALGQTAGGMKIEAFQELGLVKYITNNAEELSTMQLGQTNQTDAYNRAHDLAMGTLDVDLLTDYRRKFRRTFRQIIAENRLIGRN